jgi:AcrR family transcriptional regulator
MVQKEKSRRGRPLGFDPDTALAAAMDVFWDKGYAATSLDDLCAAMAINRPSLYAVFGDKHALYQKALMHYRRMASAQMAEVLSETKTLRHALTDFYAIALALYLKGKNGARGCFTIGTALVEAIGDPEIRAALADSIAKLDATMEKRIAFAQKRGEIAKTADPALLAKLASATLYTLAIRARAGQPKVTLQAMIDAGVDAICGGRK